MMDKEILELKCIVIQNVDVLDNFYENFIGETQNLKTSAVILELSRF